MEVSRDTEIQDPVLTPNAIATFCCSHFMVARQTLLYIDQPETFAMRFRRGAGISPVRGNAAPEGQEIEHRGWSAGRGGGRRCFWSPMRWSFGEGPRKGLGRHVSRFSSKACPILEESAAKQCNLADAND